MIATLGGVKRATKHEIPTWLQGALLGRAVASSAFRVVSLMHAVCSTLAGGVPGNQDSALVQFAACSSPWASVLRSSTRALPVMTDEEVNSEQHNLMYFLYFHVIPTTLKKKSVPFFFFLLLPLPFPFLFCSRKGGEEEGESQNIF